MRKKYLNVTKALVVAITGALVVGSGIGFTKNQYEITHAENQLDNENGKSCNVEESLGEGLYVNSKRLMEVYEQYKDVPQVYGDEKNALDKKIDDVLYSDMSYQDMKETLEKLGVYYVYGEDVEYSGSTSGNINFEGTPKIAYNSKTKQYLISAKASLPSGAIKDEVPRYKWFCPKNGDIDAIGGVDAIFLSITNTSGASAGLKINSGSASLAYGSAIKSSTNLITDNDIYGAGYEVQDCITYYNVKNRIFYYAYSYKYNAEKITCVARYNSMFRNYNGVIKMGYSHTWNNTKVSDIGLSRSGPSITFNKSNNAWTAYSYGTSFVSGKKSTKKK